MVWRVLRSVVVETCEECWAVALGVPIADELFEYVDMRLGVVEAMTIAVL